MPVAIGTQLRALDRTGSGRGGRCPGPITPDKPPFVWVLIFFVCLFVLKHLYQPKNRSWPRLCLNPLRAGAALPEADRRFPRAGLGPRSAPAEPPGLPPLRLASFFPTIPPPPFFCFIFWGGGGAPGVNPFP